MMMDFLPMWAMLVLCIVLVQLFIEIGYRLGKATHLQEHVEHESAVSAIAGSVLGLTAFVLAFSFGIVYQRYDAKKDLVREEAIAIWTAYQRADFLPKSDRMDAKNEIHRYLNLHLSLPFAAEANQQDHRQVLKAVLLETRAIQAQLWSVVAHNVEINAGLNSDVGSLYIEALNNMTALQEKRVAESIETRVHISIWITLYILTFSGMLALGFQTGVTGAKRSKASPVLACSFGVLLALITALDRPGVILVSQQPLQDVKGFIETEKSLADITIHTNKMAEP
jgi:hypothetical protein